MEEWREEPALWRCARASDSLPGRRAGRWWAAGQLGGVRKCGRRDSKSAWLAEPKNRLVRGGRSVVWSGFCCEHRPKKWEEKEEKECLAPGLAFLLLSGPATKRAKLSGGCLVSACLERPWHPSRRDGCPTDSRDQVQTGCTLTSPPPQHHDAPGRAAQNERMWEQGAWLLAQDMLGFQWLETRDQSAEAQQVLELLISGDCESGEDRATSSRRRESALCAGQGMALRS